MVRADLAISRKFAYVLGESVIPHDGVISMKIHSSSIGSVLRRARLGLRMGQGDLADLLGVTAPCLNRVEHGSRSFDTEWVALLPSPIAEAVKDALAREVEALGDGVDAA
jgi:DNA-binding XRE family transcriptional regulator